MAAAVETNSDETRCSARIETRGTTKGSAELKFRIQFPPAESQVRTCLSREFAFLGRETAVVRAGTSGLGRQRHAGAGISGRKAVISLSGPIPVPHRR